jgi:hypothetical protein
VHSIDATPRRWAVAAAALLLAGCGADQGAEGDRQEAVAERGAEVMPFDLEATTHVFEPTAGGGEQRVVADDPSDAEQVALVRQHLRDEAARFAAGDFDDPAAIHGDEMPGLAELRAGHDAVEVSFEEVDGGARLTYRTDDPALVDAIHRWFEAQLHDHGAHAEAG